MQPEWEKGRYITLTGDPIGPDGQPEKLRTSFYKAADIQAAGVATALTAVVAAVMGNPPVLILLIQGLIMATNLHTIALDRCSEKKAGFFDSGFSEEDIKTKCIDTRPDNKTPPMPERYRLAAKNVHLNSMMMLGLGAMLNLSGSVLSGITAIGLLAGMAYSTLALTSLHTRNALYAHRFNKVAKGDWVIVDMPKPKAVKETAQEPAMLPAPAAL